MDRNTIIWTLVLFFGASLMFGMIRRAAEDEGTGIALAAQVVAGGLLIVVIVLFVRRRGK